MGPVSNIEDFCMYNIRICVDINVLESLNADAPSAFACQNQLDTNLNALIFGTYMAVPHGTVRCGAYLACQGW